MSVGADNHPPVCFSDKEVFNQHTWELLFLYLN